jgi:multidrug resistance efflux pump
LGEGSDPQLRRLSSDLENAAELHRQALRDLTEKEALHRDGVISQAALEEFRAQVRSREKAVSDARLELESRRQGMDRDLLQSRSLIQQKQTEVDNLRLQLDLTRTEGISLYETQREKAGFLRSELAYLREKLAPGFLSGDRVVCPLENAVVSDITCRPGDPVDAETRILSILNLDTLMVEADVPEDFIRDVRPQAAARIVPLADPQREYRGRVTFVSQAAVEKNGETVIPVYIAIEQPDGFLKPSYNVDVSIEPARESPLREPVRS